MRTLLTRRSSTKAERKFAEILKRLHIPFQHRVRIGKREVDFLIGKYAIELDGHRQDINKNLMLLSKGYSPIHFNNSAIPNPTLDEWLKKIKP